jgi:hypothetical protein
MQAFDHMVSLISIESAFPGFHAHLLHSDARDEFQTFDVGSFAGEILGKLADIRARSSTR